MQPKCGMWVIGGTIEKKTESGTKSSQFPTFYIHPEVQGCNNPESACRIARSILNPTNDPSIVPNVYAQLVDTACVAEWTEEETLMMQAKGQKNVPVIATRDFRVGPKPGWVAVRKGDTRIVDVSNDGCFTTTTIEGNFFGSCLLGDGWMVDRQTESQRK